jgi:hypothetical protein
MQTASMQALPLPSAQFCLAIAEQEKVMHELALEVQTRFSRIVEMARLIDRESDDLCAESEAGRIRVCAEVIQEAAETARGEVERIEIAASFIRQALTGEAGNA